MTRIKKPRPFERNMLIVCEDTNTGPNYLYHLQTQAVRRNCWDYIEIFPKPPLLQRQESKSQPEHKSARKKRQFKASEEDKYLIIELESENTEQPVRYVRTVQKALSDELYNEGWAVYDLDGHTGHVKAEKTAKKSPEVNIAFSSRSIETWFLLHFEYNNSVFSKVHCKINGREQNCNVEIACAGNEECLMGYLRRNTPLSNYQKNADIFAVLKSNTRTAMLNSERLREEYLTESQLHKRNPYTTMDLLVKSMLRQMSLGETKEVSDFTLTVIACLPVMKIEVKNISGQRQILHKSHFKFLNEQDFTFTGGGVFDSKEIKTIEISDFAHTDNMQIKFPADNERDFCLILC